MSMLCWRLYVGDSLKILIIIFVCIFCWSLKYQIMDHLKSFDQHIWSPTSVNSIDLAQNAQLSACWWANYDYIIMRSIKSFFRIKYRLQIHFSMQLIHFYANLKGAVGFLPCRDRVCHDDMYSSLTGTYNGRRWCCVKAHGTNEELNFFEIEFIFWSKQLMSCEWCS